MATEQSRSNLKEPNWLSRFMPLFQWAPQYERSWLRFDLIAGLTVAALVIPKALGSPVSLDYREKAPFKYI